MPLYKEHRWEHFHLAIWSIEPGESPDFPLAELSGSDQKRLQELKNPNRKAEFLAARSALAHILEATPQIEYSPKGAPSLAQWKGLSISHNKDYAAVIVSKHFKVGLDLEAYRPQMLQLCSRYMSKQELGALGSEPDLEMLAAYWSAKEALIKVKDAPDLDLRKEIRIAPFAKGRSAVSRGLIRKGKHQEIYPLYFKMENNYCLCFTLD
ncbi:4'-phosphopantetheinyl transferase superfamily protein [Croceimicrobium sp.]|uniref:4'-phosphopantetheinyl transferase superfamily protein n=1 Tax=Croceimicrobium sp. TaxID=2828340 RepID=UPI003BACA75D